MKNTFAPRTARALAPFLAATALVSIPAFAQEVAPQTAPAQPVFTPPSSATVPIPPVTRTVPDGTPPAADATDAAPAKPAVRAAKTTRTVTRSTTNKTVARSTPAPVAPPAPEAAAPPAPAAVAPVDTTNAAPAPAPAPVAAPAPEPAAPVANSGSSDTSTTTTTIPVWAWVAGGIAALAIIFGALLAMRRRREEYEYDEPAYVEDTYVEPAPVAVAPVLDRDPVSVAKAAPRKEPEYLRRAPIAPAVEPVIAAPDEVALSTPAAEDVAELTAGTAPVAERPWLEFAMRPVRAGTNVDEALVEIELTVGNAGSVDARDVRISTFLLSGDPRGSEMERLLVNPPADATTDPVTIKPGEGKRVDATLALLKSDMGEVLPDSIRPIVVADARYTLADGSEGRTSASFVIGVTPEEGTLLEPLELNRSSMHDNVAAELHGEPQHA